MRVRLTSRSPSLYPTTTSSLLRYRTESTIIPTEKLLNLRRFLPAPPMENSPPPEFFPFVFYLTEAGCVLTETGRVVGLVVVEFPASLAAID